MAEVSSVPQKVTREGLPPSGPSLRSLLRSTEIDTRLLGLVLALGFVWIGFNVMSGGLFLTPRNLFNLSVQSASTERPHSLSAMVNGRHAGFVCTSPSRHRRPPM